MYFVVIFWVSKRTRTIEFELKKKKKKCRPDRLYALDIEKPEFFIIYLKSARGKKNLFSLRNEMFFSYFNVPNSKYFAIFKNLDGTAF